MAKNRIIEMTVVLTISVILLGSLLVPTITDAHNQTVTITNTSDEIRLSPVESVTISKEAGVGDAMIINGETITLSAANAVVIADSFVINARVDQIFMIFGASYVSVVKAASLTATISEGTFTYQINDGSAVEKSYTGNLMAATPEGKYVNITPGSGIKAYTDSLDNVTCWTYSTNLMISHGETLYVNGVETEGLNLADSETDGYYTLDTSAIKLDTESINAGPTNVIVPYSFTIPAFGSDAFDILMVAPLLFIAALILGVVALFRRDD